MKSKFHFRSTFFLFFLLTSIHVNAQQSNSFVGKWALTAQNIEVYDGNKLVRTSKTEAMDINHLDFSANNVVSCIIDTNVYKFRYTPKGKELLLTSINGDIDDLSFTFEFKNGYLYLRNEFLDDPEDDSIKDPKLYFALVYKKK